LASGERGACGGGAGRQAVCAGRIWGGEEALVMGLMLVLDRLVTGWW
jgi:hypothetical protein